MFFVVKMVVYSDYMAVGFIAGTGLALVCANNHVGVNYMSHYIIS